MGDHAKMVDGILVRAKRLMIGLEVQVEGKENREEKACLGLSGNYSLGQEMWSAWRVRLLLGDHVIGLIRKKSFPTPRTRV